MTTAASQRYVRGGLAIGASLIAPTFAGGLFASAQAAEGQLKTAPIEEVVVTNSRLDLAGFQAPTPTTVFGAEDIESSGITHIGQLAYQMPQFQPSTNPTTASTTSGGGGSNFNMRGLGNNRTLLLVDGRRHVPNAPNGTVDTNVIPAGLVERVEVVTGGASAAWGSDAVAGVVNLILRKRFEGLELEAQAGSSEHGDAEDYRASALFGRAFAGERGHFVLAGEYSNNKGISDQTAREWGRKEWWIVNNPRFAPGNGEFARLIAPGARTGNATEGGLILTGVLAGTRFEPGGVPVQHDPGEFPLGASGTIGGDGVNMGKYAQLVVPLERGNIFSHMSFDVSDSLEAYAELSAAYSESIFDITQPFHFGNITIFSDNAYLPASMRATMQAAGQTNFRMGRIDTDIGFIQSSSQNYTQRGVVGLNGTFGEGWSWGAYYQYGRSREDRHEYGNLIVANYNRASDAVFNSANQIVCRSTLTNPGDGCVPLNLFGEGAPSAAAIDYVTGTEQSRTTLQLHATEFSVRGTPFSTWAGPVAIAAGVEYREQTFEVDANDLTNSGAFLIGNPRDVSGSETVKEGFFEAAIPLLSDVPLVKSLELNVADRYTDYSISGSANTWKIGLTHQVTETFRFRAARSLDIRAPSLQELFSPPGISFANLRDPGTGASAIVQILTGNSTDLVEETADTLTIGLVYEPSWLSGLRTSVDYYDIHLKDAISLLGAQDIVNRCAAGNAALCRNVTRNDLGVLQEVRATRTNLSEIKLSGVDVELMYRMPLSVLVDRWDGSVSFRVLGAYIDRAVTDDGITAIDRAGQMTGSGVPEWRLNGHVAYENGPFTFGVSARYVDSGLYDNTFGPFDINDNKVPSRTYFDLNLQYALGQEEQIELFAHVKNVLDRDPSIVPNPFFIPLATNPTFYDTIGRSFAVGARVRF